MVPKDQASLPLGPPCGRRFDICLICGILRFPQCKSTVVAVGPLSNFLGKLKYCSSKVAAESTGVPLPRQRPLCCRGCCRLCRLCSDRQNGHAAICARFVTDSCSLKEDERKKK